MAALQKMHGSLWHLPTELVIEIMKYAPDFSCLWSLINASSRFKSIFIMAARGIVEAVMAQADIPTCIKALMQVVVNARTASGFSDIEDVTKSMSREKPCEFWWHQQPQVLHDFVELAHNIHAVAHACLDYYIEKTRHMKPQCLDYSDLDTIYTSSSLLYSERQSQGRPYQPEDSGPPSAEEEQRMIRLLWRIQAFFTLKAACSEGALANWPEEDRRRLETSNLSDMFHLFHGPNCTWGPDWEIEQFLSVVEFLTETTGVTEDSLANFLCRPSMAIYNKGYQPRCFPNPPPILVTVRGVKHCIEIDYKLERSPKSWYFYQNLTKDIKYSPLQNVPFAPYRRYGFAIWDTNRVVTLGFLGPTSDRPRRFKCPYRLMVPMILFTWRSILTPEEDAEGVTIYPHFFSNTS